MNHDIMVGIFFSYTNFKTIKNLNMICNKIGYLYGIFLFINFLKMEYLSIFVYLKIKVHIIIWQYIFFAINKYKVLDYYKVLAAFYCFIRWKCFLFISEDDSSRKVGNLYETSKFRQQVETLRKVGGSDWLRLLNEMHSSTHKVIKYTLVNLF